MDMVQDKFLRKIRLDPFWQAIAEMFFAIGFTFGPIFLLSIPLTPSDGKISSSIIGENFWSYWTAGQLALPILSLCGAIASVAVIEGRSLHRGLVFLAWSFALVLAIACGFALSKSNGFQESLLSSVIWFGFIAYIILLILWVVLTAQAGKSEGRADPEERAKSLLRQKNQIKSIDE